MADMFLLSVLEVSVFLPSDPKLPHNSLGSFLLPSTVLQLVIFIFAPLCLLFLITFPCALTFCLPFFFISCIQAVFPPMFIFPLLSEVFHFWHLCSFSIVLLWCSHLPPMLQPFWFAYFP